MGAQRTSFAKLQRDRAKKAKAALKRERRQGGQTEQPREHDTASAVVDDGGELSAPVLLALIEQIHKQFDNEEISFEEFEEKKIDLLSRLPID